MPKWSAQHYNALAKEIREVFPVSVSSTEIDRWRVQGQRGILAELALSLARRFKEDNPLFDLIKFLNACSPDELYPIAELWEEDE